MSDYRPRIRSRLSADIHERLILRAERPDMSVPKILDEALRAYFDGQVQDGRNTALLQRLELMSRHDHRQSKLWLYSCSIFSPSPRTWFRQIRMLGRQKGLRILMII